MMLNLMRMLRETNLRKGKKLSVRSYVYAPFYCYVLLFTSFRNFICKLYTMGTDLGDMVKANPAGDANAE